MRLFVKLGKGQKVDKSACDAHFSGAPNRRGGVATEISACALRLYSL
jgi:hypothetical protein